MSINLSKNTKINLTQTPPNTDSRLNFYQDHEEISPSIGNLINHRHASNDILNMNLYRNNLYFDSEKHEGSPKRGHGSKLINSPILGKKSSKNKINHNIISPSLNSGVGVNKFTLSAEDERHDRPRRKSNRNFWDEKKETISASNTKEEDSLEKEEADVIIPAIKKKKRTYKMKTTLSITKKKLLFKKEKTFKCKCDKSKCKKKYCECFHNGEICDPKVCQCESCENMHTKAVLLRPSESFNQPGFCNCTKSNCQKQYCECFKIGRECNILCRCLKCANSVKKKMNDGPLLCFDFCQEFFRISIDAGVICEVNDIEMLRMKRAREVFAVKNVQKEKEKESTPKTRTILTSPIFTTSCATDSLRNKSQGMKEKESVIKKLEMTKYRKVKAFTKN